MITDFYLADKSEAAMIAAGSAGVVPALRTNNAHNSVLADLWSALDSSADAASLEGEECIIFAVDGGPWVFELPDELVKCLAALSDEEAGPLCDRWALGPEMQHFNLTGVDLVGPLADLRRVASLSSQSGKPVLLRMSM